VTFDILKNDIKLLLRLKGKCHSKIDKINIDR